VAELKPVYLLTGSDRPKVTRALQRLRERFDPDAVELRSAHETSGADATAACNAMGLFGSERLVVVDAVERWKADDAKAITAYLGNPAPTAVLALVAGELRKDAAIAKAVAKVGEVLVIVVARKKLVDWVAQQFAGLGTRVDRELCRSLVEAVVPEGQDADLHHLANEVAKIVTWANGEPIEWTSVRELVVPFGEIPSFALTDAWGARDLGAALSAVESSFEREASARRDIAPRLLYALVRHLARLEGCRALLAEGHSSHEIASRLKRHPYYVQKLVRQAENFSEE
jgi:DNA polymerase-3 subunit delta